MIFYFCPSCKKFWQYPIEKCPDCFLSLEKLKSKEVKVIGSGKTIISSVFHQKVPYHVMVLEDEGGRRWVQKSEKELKAGEFFNLEKAKDKEAVGIWRIKYDFFEAIEKLFEILNFSFKKDLKILILPTLIEGSHSYLRNNTSPQFLETLIKFLVENGINSEDIIVGVQSFDEVEIEKKFQKSGISEIFQRQKIRNIDLAKGDFIKKGDLEISEEVFKAGLILNLPILKMGKACATENLFFLLKKENYLAQKYLYSELEIFKKLKDQLPQVLTIAEAGRVQDKRGISHYLGLALASFNPQNLDRVFFEIVREKNLPEILKDIKIESIEIVGRKISEVEFYL